MRRLIQPTVPRLVLNSWFGVFPGAEKLKRVVVLNDSVLLLNVFKSKLSVPSAQASVVTNPVVRFLVAAEMVLCESRMISGVT